MGHSWPLFQYVRLFNTVGGENNFANDWIQTALPTEPQPLPSGTIISYESKQCSSQVPYNLSLIRQTATKLF